MHDFLQKSPRLSFASAESRCFARVCRCCARVLSCCCASRGVVVQNSLANLWLQGSYGTRHESIYKPKVSQCRANRSHLHSDVVLLCLVHRRQELFEVFASLAAAQRCSRPRNLPTWIKCHVWVEVFVKVRPSVSTLGIFQGEKSSTNSNEVYIRAENVAEDIIFVAHFWGGPQTM